MNKSVNRKRRVVEIYFILYLAALILLIPDSKDKEIKQENIKENIFRLDFSLKPLKTTLTCKLVIDSGKVKIISLDSLNTIFYTGKVKDVTFDFNIEDKSLKRAIKLEEGISRTKYFNFTQNHNEQTAEFKWFPPLHERQNKVYIVEVEATAKSKASGNIIKEKTQFSLNVIYLNDYYSEDLTVIADTSEFAFSNEEQPQNPFLLSSPVFGEFSIVPRSGDISTFALSKWEKYIDAYSINLQQDLLRNPKIEISGVKEGIEGSIDYDILDRNTLLLKGTAPEYGSSKVRITLTRSYDNRSVTEEFNVTTLMLGEPSIPKTMYPEIKYTLKPNLPLSSSANTVALIKNRNNDTIAISYRGGDIYFTPSHNDTSGSLYFERYIDGKLIGQRITVNIASYPPPQLSSPMDFSDNSGKKVVIYSDSKGVINGKENFVTELIITGNAKYRELTGSEIIDPKTKNIRQKFEIMPKDPSKTFVFKVKAKNYNGKLSKEINYPEI